MSGVRKRAGLCHKCYELLVQLKTEHIVSGQERHAHERTIHEYAHNSANRRPPIACFYYTSIIFLACLLS